MQLDDIGRKIYTLRHEKNISQETLAAAIYVSRQTISRWEMGECQPSLDNIEQLCGYFGKELQFFLGEQAVTEPSEPAKPKKPLTPIITALKISTIIMFLIIVVIGLVVGAIAIYIYQKPKQEGLIYVGYSTDLFAEPSVLILICIMIILGIGTIITFITFLVLNKYSRKKNWNQTRKL